MEIDSASRQSHAITHHICGMGAKEYLTPQLQDIMKGMEPYFKLGDKFAETSHTPPQLFTQNSQRLHYVIDQCVVQNDTEELTTVTFRINVPEDHVLDVQSMLMDIRGRVDKGASFKPYEGTAYNPLLPKNQMYNHVRNYNAGAPPASCFLALDSEVAAGAAAVANITGAINVRPDQGGTNLDAHRVGQDLTRSHNPDGAYVGRAVGVGNATPEDRRIAFGAYAPPITATGRTSLSAGGVARALRLDGTGNAQNAGMTHGVRVEDTHITYPDTRVMALGNAAGECYRTANMPNYVGFRDNFNGLMYYDGADSQCAFMSENRNNLIQHLPDRNTELSYTYEVARKSKRMIGLDAYNQHMDSYDPTVRFFTNLGYQDAPCQAAAIRSNAGRVQPSHPVQATNPAGVDYANNQPADPAMLAYGGGLDSCEINIEAWLYRNWIKANIGDYMPQSHRTVFPAGANALALHEGAGNREEDPEINSYDAFNFRTGYSALVDIHTNLGARWSVDVMDYVNPFNHHKNNGLIQRSLLLGPARRSHFHIQVPQKHFGLKRALLLPGTYMYRWQLRRDPNVVLQSSLGIDLREDGAAVHYDQVQLYVSFFPFSSESAAALTSNLRLRANDQVFHDYHSAVHKTVEVPANAESVQFTLTNNSLQYFRGWSFGRIRSSEYRHPRVKDPALRYSGTNPNVDGTYYLNHTFRSVSINWDYRDFWPGRARLLNSEKITIKDQRIDLHNGHQVFQSPLHKDMALIVQAGQYKSGFQGFSAMEVGFDPDPYSFGANFKTMVRQRLLPRADHALDNIADRMRNQVPLNGNAMRHNNSGAVAGFRDGADPFGSVRDTVVGGYPYPANDPACLIGPLAPTWEQMVTEKKFLIDRHCWHIPFSDKFVNISSVTEMGESRSHMSETHSLNMTFELDPLPFPSLVHIMFHVFDTFRLQQDIKDDVKGSYFRIPFQSFVQV